MEKKKEVVMIDLTGMISIPYLKENSIYRK